MGCGHWPGLAGEREGCGSPRRKVCVSGCGQRPRSCGFGSDDSGHLGPASGHLGPAARGRLGLVGRGKWLGLRNWTSLVRGSFLVCGSFLVRGLARFTQRMLVPTLLGSDKGQFHTALTKATWVWWGADSGVASGTGLWSADLLVRGLAGPRILVPTGRVL